MATINIELDLAAGEVVALTVANLSPDYDDPDPEGEEIPEEVKPVLIKAIGGKAA
jgi:hypothetical protein